MRRSVRHLRDRGIVEDLQQEYHRHGDRDDFLEQRRHSISDGGYMRQFQGGLATRCAVDRTVIYNVTNYMYTNFAPGRY